MMRALGGIVVIAILMFFLTFAGFKNSVQVEFSTPEHVVVNLTNKPPATKAEIRQVKLSAAETKPKAPEPKAQSPSQKPEQPREEPALPAPDPNRPSWVGQPAKLENGVYRMSVPSGLYVTRLECERALDVVMHDAVVEYVENYLGIDEAKLVTLDDRYIKNNIQKDEYEETIVRSIGPMQQVVAKLEFDKNVRADIMDRYRAAIIHMRLWTIGSGTLALLALLGTLFGYLKLDLLTSGHHRRRLQWAAAATILGVVAGAALIQTQALSARL